MNGNFNGHFNFSNIPHSNGSASLGYTKPVGNNTSVNVTAYGANYRGQTVDRGASVTITKKF